MSGSPKNTKRSSFLSWYRKLMPRDVVGFFYHIVSEHRLPHIENLYPYKTPHEFEQDLLHLKELFTPVGYQELYAWAHHRHSLPRNAAFISFDDGFIECETVIRPLLEKHSLPCMFFISTAFLDNNCPFRDHLVSLCLSKVSSLSETNFCVMLSSLREQYGTSVKTRAQFEEWLFDISRDHEKSMEPLCDMLEIDIEYFSQTSTPFLSTNQVLSLHHAGYIVGAHGRHHRYLGAMEPAEQKEEIVTSCRAVCDILGVSQAPFAFPFDGCHVENSVLREVRERHPEVGLIFDSQSLKSSPSFVFQRIWADDPRPDIAFDANLSMLLLESYREQFWKSLRQLPSRAARAVRGFE